MDNEKIYNSLERIEDKLDSHFERIVRVEEKVKSQGGAIKAALSGIVAIVSSILLWALKQVFPGSS